MDRWPNETVFRRRLRNDLKNVLPQQKWSNVTPDDLTAAVVAGDVPEIDRLMGLVQADMTREALRRREHRAGQVRTHLLCALEVLADAEHGGQRTSASDRRIAERLLGFESIQRAVDEASTARSYARSCARRALTGRQLPKPTVIQLRDWPPSQTPEDVWASVLSAVRSQLLAGLDDLAAPVGDAQDSPDAGLLLDLA